MNKNYVTPKISVTNWSKEVLTDIVNTSAGGGSTPWEGQADFFTFAEVNP